MSDTPQFVGTYPENAPATLSCTVRYDSNSLPSSVLTLPDFYLRPGQRLSLSMDIVTGRIRVELFGVE